MKSENLLVKTNAFHMLRTSIGVYWQTREEIEFALFADSKTLNFSRDLCERFDQFYQNLYFDEENVKRSSLVILGKEYIKCR